MPPKPRKRRQAPNPRTEHRRQSALEVPHVNYVLPKHKIFYRLTH